MANASVSGPSRPANIIRIIRALPAGLKNADSDTGAPPSLVDSPTVANADVVSKRVRSRSRPSVSRTTPAAALRNRKAMSEMKNARATRSAASRRPKRCGSSSPRTVARRAATVTRTSSS